MAGKQQSTSKGRVVNVTTKASAGDGIRFSTEYEPNDGFSGLKDVDREAMDLDEDEDDGLHQLLEAYKTQASKASSNGKVAQAKADILFMDTRSQMAALKSEFDAFIEGARQNIQELQEQEQRLPLEQLAAIFGRRNVQKGELKALLDIYQDAIPEVSRQTAQQVELFRNDVRKIRGARSNVFRQSVSGAKSIVNRALEEQKLAADSTALIKNFMEIVKT